MHLYECKLTKRDKQNAKKLFYLSDQSGVSLSIAENPYRLYLSRLHSIVAFWLHST